MKIGNKILLSIVVLLILLLGYLLFFEPNKRKEICINNGYEGYVGFNDKDYCIKGNNLYEVKIYTIQNKLYYINENGKSKDR